VVENSENIYKLSTHLPHCIWVKESKINPEILMDCSNYTRHFKQFYWK